MGEMAVRPQQGRELATSGPGRQLGLRVQPQLRLAMGYRDEEHRGAPVKTDYFVLGPSGEVEFAAERERFIEVLGPQPTEIPVMLPAQLGAALDIRHRAWGGGSDSGGGALKAIGQTNFALVGTLGGPDVLTTWSNETGEIEEHTITGLDDPLAQELKVELSATLTFGIPSVLGIGAFAAIDSRGKQTIDTLWVKLVELYAIFGPRISYAVQPVLFMRKATARYFDTKAKPSPKWRTSTFYALDLRVPETLEQTFTRLRERDALLSGESSVGAGLPVDSESAFATAAGGVALPSAPPAAPHTSLPAPEPEPVEAVEVDPADVQEPPGEAGNPEQTTLDGSPTREQIRKLKAVLEDLRTARAPAELIADGGEIEEFEDWPSYCRRYCQLEFNVESSTSVDGEQMEQLIAHLDQLTIPF